jgi:hypothetical protein
LVSLDTLSKQMVFKLMVCQGKCKRNPSVMFHAVESADIYDVMETMQEPPQVI